MSFLPFPRRDEYETTHVVQDRFGWHTHYYVPPAPETGSGLRTIFATYHCIDACRDLYLFKATFKASFELLAKHGFPVDQVHDWTPEEVEKVTIAFCPETPAAFAERDRSDSEFRQLSEDLRLHFSLRTAPTFQSERGSQRARAKSPECCAGRDDFPLAFEADKMCPVCTETTLSEGNYFLELPCRHLVCVQCYRSMRNRQITCCSLCKKPMVEDFIKRV